MSALIVTAILAIIAVMATIWAKMFTCAESKTRMAEVCRASVVSILLLAGLTLLTTTMVAVARR